MPLGIEKSHLLIYSSQCKFPCISVAVSCDHSLMAHLGVCDNPYNTELYLLFDKAARRERIYSGLRTSLVNGALIRTISSYSSASMARSRIASYS